MNTTKNQNALASGFRRRKTFGRVHDCALYSFELATCGSSRSLAIDLDFGVPASQPVTFLSTAFTTFHQVTVRNSNFIEGYDGTDSVLSLYAGLTAILDTFKPVPVECSIQTHDPISVHLTDSEGTQSFVRSVGLAIKCETDGGGVFVFEPTPVAEAMQRLGLTQSQVYSYLGCIVDGPVPTHGIGIRFLRLLAPHIHHTLRKYLPSVYYTANRKRVLQYVQTHSVLSTDALFDGATVVGAIRGGVRDSHTVAVLLGEYRLKEPIPHIEPEVVEQKMREDIRIYVGPAKTPRGWCKSTHLAKQVFGKCASSKTLAQLFREDDVRRRSSPSPAQKAKVVRDLVRVFRFDRRTHRRVLFTGVDNPEGEPRVSSTPQGVTSTFGLYEPQAGGVGTVLSSILGLTTGFLAFRAARKSVRTVEALAGQASQLLTAVNDSVNRVNVSLGPDVVTFANNISGAVDKASATLDQVGGALTQVAHKFDFLGTILTIVGGASVVGVLLKVVKWLRSIGHDDEEVRGAARKVLCYNEGVSFEAQAAMDTGPIKTILGAGAASFLAFSMVGKGPLAAPTAAILWRSFASMEGFARGISHPVDWVCGLFECVARKVTGKEGPVFFRKATEPLLEHRKFQSELLLMSSMDPTLDPASAMEGAARLRNRIDALVTMLPMLPATTQKSLTSDILRARQLIAKASAPSMRVEPLAVMISGPPGVGKSYITRWISKFIVERYHSSRLGDFGTGTSRTFRDEMFYAQVLDQKFIFEGFLSHTVFIYDDMGHTREALIKGITPVDFLISAVTGNGLETVQAEASKKGATPFNAPLILLTTNHTSNESLVGKIAASPQAVARRYGVLTVELRRSTGSDLLAHSLSDTRYNCAVEGKFDSNRFNRYLDTYGDFSAAFDWAFVISYTNEKVHGSDECFELPYASLPGLKDIGWLEFCQTIAAEYEFRRSTYSNTVRADTVHSVDPLPPYVPQSGGDSNGSGGDGDDAGFPRARTVSEWKSVLKIKPGDAIEAPLDELAWFQDMFTEFLKSGNVDDLPLVPCYDEELHPIDMDATEWPTTPTTTTVQGPELTWKVGGLEFMNPLGLWHALKGALRCGLLQGLFDQIKALYVRVVPHFDVYNDSPVSAMIRTFILSLGAILSVFSVHAIIGLLRKFLGMLGRIVSTVVNAVAGMFGRKPRASHTKVRRKFGYNVFAPQSSTSEGDKMVDIMTKRSRSVCNGVSFIDGALVNLGNGSTKAYLGTMLHLRDNYYLVPKHFLVKSPDTIIALFMRDGVEREAVIHVKALEPQTVNVGGDLCVIHTTAFDAWKPKGLLNRFYTESQIRDLTVKRLDTAPRQPAALVLSTVGSLEICAGVCDMRATNTPYITDGSGFNPLTLGYEIPTKKGYCGALLTLVKNVRELGLAGDNVAASILGVHVCGSASNLTGHAELVTRERLCALTSGAMLACNPPKEVFEEQAGDPSAVTTTVARFHSLVTGPKYFCPIGKSKIVPTAANDIVGDTLVNIGGVKPLPVHLENFTQEGFLEMVPRSVDDDMLPYLRLAASQICERYLALPSDISAVLTDEQVVCGVGVLDPMLASQGSLFPWNIKYPTRGEVLRGGDLLPEFAECVAALEQEAVATGKLDVCFMPFPKDETRKPPKHLTPRGIFACPLHFTFLYRKHFGSVLHGFFKHNMSLGAMPGMQIYSDWARFMNYLTFEGQLDPGAECFNDYDIKFFDQSQLPAITGVLWDHIVEPVCARLPGNTRESGLIRKALWFGMTRPLYFVSQNPKAACKDMFFQMGQGLPSGVPLTTFTNTLYSAVVLIASFMRASVDIGLFSNMFHAERATRTCLRVATYGDDSGQSARGPLLGVPPDAVFSAALKCGITLTDGQKVGNGSHYKRLWEIEMLKRTTVECRLGCMVFHMGALAPASILSSLAYWKSSERSVAVWKAKLCSAMQETVVYRFAFGTRAHEWETIYYRLVDCINGAISVMSEFDPSFAGAVPSNWEWAARGQPCPRSEAWLAKMLHDPDMTAAAVHGWYRVEP